MTQDEIDTIWQQAMRQSIEDGEMYTRYHFAKLVIDYERERCCSIVYSQCDSDNVAQRTVDAIKGQQ